MRIVKYLVFVLLLALTAPAAARAQGEKTQVRLVLSADGAKPGDTVTAGIELRLAAEWHTYWRNPGDSGSPIKIQWTLPAGITVGELEWPVPQKLTEEGLTTYVYNDEVMLLAPLKLATNLAAGPIEIKARVDWLECQKQCVMRNADASIALRVGGESKPSADAGLIKSWRQKVPQFVADFPARVWWEKPPTGDTRPVIIELDGNPAVADFFPFAGEKFEVTNATERLAGDGGKVRLRKTVTRQEGEWPTELQGVLMAQATAKGPVDAHEVHLKLLAAPGAAGTPTSATAGAGSGAQAVPAKSSLLLMLGFAFLGGLILNIMPCVLPVIALKILGFVQQSREAPQRVRKLGLIYGLGVLVSFLVLAAVVIGVQQAGHAANWGMQFQNPKFLVLMTTLVMLVALNLFGVFEVNLGGRALDVAGGLAAKEGTSGAFFNGVLATALATPCTAPFLAPALGFAFAQSAGVIVVMFLAIGLGLASPYIALSWHPAWLRFLPKPGLWMERFKQAMGFPMLATAVWLFTLTTPYFGESASFWLGMYLVLMALASWVQGEFVQRGSKHRTEAGVMALMIVGFAFGFVLEHELDWRSASATSSKTAPRAHLTGGIDWTPWSEAAVQQARAAGHPVLVDFTADWCVTCQVNKKTSLEIDSVRAKLKAIKAVTMIGDYTRADDAITAELKRFGRAGVPLVLVYPADLQADPVVLPDGFLTPNVVLEALDKAAPAKNRSAAGMPGSRRTTCVDRPPRSNDQLTGICPSAYSEPFGDGLGGGPCRCTRMSRQDERGDVRTSC